jgi:hypothetical protein
MQKFVGKREVFLTRSWDNGFSKGGIFWIFYVRYLTLLHLPIVRFHCVGGC